MTYALHGHEILGVWSLSSSRDSGSVVAVLSPNKKFLSSVYFMGLMGDKEQAMTGTSPDNRVRS